MHSDPTLAQVQNASPEDLVLMLFEGAVRFGREARRAIDAGDRPRAEQLVGRVRAIVRELENGLNPEAGAISRHLAAIYEYVLRRLEPADVDAEIIDEVVADIEVLCEAWSALVARRQADVAPAVA
jgi:flagellar secretion chaperone FliS